LYGFLLGVWELRSKIGMKIHVQHEKNGVVVNQTNGKSIVVLRYLDIPKDPSLEEI